MYNEKNISNTDVFYIFLRLENVYISPLINCPGNNEIKKKSQHSATKTALRESPMPAVYNLLYVTSSRAHKFIP